MAVPRRVGILGSGIVGSDTMGPGIAGVAAHGREVVRRSMSRADTETVPASLERSLARQLERGHAPTGGRTVTLARATPTAEVGGRSNGAEKVAVAALDAGFEVANQGIRLRPDQIVAIPRAEGGNVDVIGLSILWGSHLELVLEVLDLLRGAGVDAGAVVGGIIPPRDAGVLGDLGVAAVCTPKDFEMSRIMTDLEDLAERRRCRR